MTCRVAHHSRTIRLARQLRAALLHAAKLAFFQTAINSMAASESVISQPTWTALRSL
jgi:hypothetical protein